MTDICFLVGEITEAVRRLTALAGDRVKTQPESADQYYLLLAIRELQRAAAAMTPSTLAVEEARHQLDKIFLWRDRKRDENKDEYRKAVDALVAVARAGTQEQDDEQLLEAMRRALKPMNVTTPGMASCVSGMCQPDDCGCRKVIALLRAEGRAVPGSPGDAA